MSLTDSDRALTAQPREYVSDKVVLLVISTGLIAILLSIIIGLLRSKTELPNWAENVFVSIATASALKLGDCLATLVALSTGRQTERLSTKLAESAPASGAGATKDAADGADEAAGAAVERANEIRDEVTS